MNDADPNFCKRHGYYAMDCPKCEDEFEASRAQPEQEEAEAWVQTENFIDADGLWGERKTLNFEGNGTALYRRSYD